jgi:hypothetical protein
VYVLAYRECKKRMRRQKTEKMKNMKYTNKIGKTEREVGQWHSKFES